MSVYVHYIYVHNCTCILTYTTVYKYVNTCTKTRKEYTEKICARVLGLCFFHYFVIYSTEHYTETIIVL